MLINAFMTPRQLRARGLPLRAPAAALTRAANTGRGIVYGLDLALLAAAGGIHSLTAFAACLAGLVACHVATYAIETRPASLKPRAVIARR